jgi:Zn-dependent metalloprotease
MSNITRTDGFIPTYLLEKAFRATHNLDFARTIYDTSELFIKGRDGRIRTRNSKGNSQRFIYDCAQSYNLPGTKARFEGGKAVSDQVVNDCYDFMGQYRDFLKQTVGRNGLIGTGDDFIGSVHYGQGYNNAYSNGKSMVFGDGDGKIFIKFVLLGIIGHEDFHVVQSNESDLEYEGESGMGNEAGADISGASTQMWAGKIKSRDFNWLVGEGAFGPKVKGRGLRNMLYPGTAYDDPDLGKDPQPATYSQLQKYDYDNGGVHIGSGIINSAFARFCIAVDGYAVDGPWPVFYNTYCGKMKVDSNANIHALAQRSVEVCSSMLPKQTDKLVQAWKEVEVAVK